MGSPWKSTRLAVTDSVGSTHGVIIGGIAVTGKSTTVSAVYIRSSATNGTIRFEYIHRGPGAGRQTTSLVMPEGGWKSAVGVQHYVDISGGSTVAQVIYKNP